MGQTWSQSFPPASKFDVHDIPDLSGKVMIVTGQYSTFSPETIAKLSLAGGNSGIGKETVRALLAHNATVYLACRSPEKGKAAIDELKADTGKEPLFLQLDLASLKSVRSAAEEFLSKEQQLHTLFNNGSVSKNFHI